MPDQAPPPLLPVAREVPIDVMRKEANDPDTVAGLDRIGLHLRPAGGHDSDAMPTSRQPFAQPGNDQFRAARHDRRIYIVCNEDMHRWAKASDGGSGARNSDSGSTPLPPR